MRYYIERTSHPSLAWYIAGIPLMVAINISLEYQKGKPRVAVLKKTDTNFAGTIWTFVQILLNRKIKIHAKNLKVYKGL